jgi:GNAT superfamily N-acetyltransferase
MARVMRAAVRGEAGRYPAPLVTAWGSLPALYHRWAVTAGGEERIVAVDGGRVVGFAGRRGGEVTALFVRPAAGGRGLGSRLLAAVEAAARRAGRGRLSVQAARGAVPYYRARGWRVARAEPAPLPGGMRLPAAWLEK